MEFIVYSTTPYKDTCGGIMVLYELAKTLHSLGNNVSIYCAQRKNQLNPIHSKFASDNDIRQSTCVIYPEVVTGNPLNAKLVVRWILMDPDTRTTTVTPTWNKTDLIWYYSSYNKNVDIGDKILFVLNINPLFRITNTSSRFKTCFTIRKESLFHSNPKHIHPKDSIQIKKQNQNDLIKIFNECEYFYCYDPYTYLVFIAAMCGCIPIVLPIKGMTKDEWISTLFCGSYFKKYGTNELKGIAYGMDEIEFAKQTLHEAKTQQLDMQKFGIETCKNFVESFKT